jgi:hypothetical protein
MNKVDKIGREIKGLSPTELADFRKWFRDFDAEAWDLQIEADVKAGKLDAPAGRALRDFASGKAHEM